MRKSKHNPIFAIAADDYVANILPLQKHSSAVVIPSRLQILVAEFGSMPISKIQTRDIQRFILKMNASCKPRYTKKIVQLLRSILYWTDPDWVWPRQVKLPKQYRTPQASYSVDEMKTLIFRLQGSHQAIVMLLSETGCRIGEALALQTRDVVNGTLSISRDVYDGILQSTPKTPSSIRKLCITRKLEDVLRFQMDQNHPTAYIFRDQFGNPLKTTPHFQRLKAACDKLGLIWKGHHAFRRGNVTFMRHELGMPLEIIGMRIGHLTGILTLDVYCNTEAGKDKPYLDKIEELLYNEVQRRENETENETRRYEGIREGSD